MSTNIEHQAASLENLHPWVDAASIARTDSAAKLGDAFREVRERALRNYLSSVPPTKRNEFWRFTHPEQLSLELLRTPLVAETSLHDLNGNVLEVPPSGTEWLSIPAAFAKRGAQITDILFHRHHPELTSISSAQLAAVSGGGVFIVSAGTEMEQTVRIRTQTLEADSGSITPLIVLIIERGASARVLWEVVGEGKCLVAPRLEVLVERDARLNLGTVQQLGSSVRYLSRERISLMRNASVFLAQAMLGGRVSRSDLDLLLLEMGASADVRAGYVVDGHRHVDLHPTQYHLAPHCTSNVTARGVLRGRSRGVYYGYIRVAEGAQKTDAYQSNRNLLLSPDARVDAIPNLEIIANDVRCSHGASVSRVGEEDLFYLQSRGIPRDVAERMIVQGFFADLWSSLPDAGIRSTMVDVTDVSIGFAGPEV